MVAVPLVLKLKKQAHRQVAEAQDLVVKELFNVFDGAVLHGGTAIWRCYGGNRFSEDIDVYMPRDEGRMRTFFKNLVKTGFKVQKKKTTENALYSSLDFNETVVRFEALFKDADGAIREYETSDGNLLMVYALTPEKLVKEKTAAYLQRLKVRDLYDVFYLLPQVRDRAVIRKDLEKLAQEYRPPLDEKDLKVLIIEGLAPTAGKMLEYISRWSHG
jgi:predicted nucleotidyltransferase component of viral defense system